jgi:hypothetical protein
MSLSDQRMTAIDIINEVRRKSKINPVTTLDADKDALTKLAYLNDVVSEVSDYGNWQESLVSITVTAQSSVADYSINVSAYPVIQNIHEVVFDNQSGEMRMVTLDTIRRLQRSAQWGRPVPVSAQDGLTFNVLAYSKPPFITTAQSSLVPPFPGKLLVQGLVVKTVLDESDGEPSARYQSVKQVYDDMLYESFNRYNGDSGSTVFFRPGRGRR